MRRTHTVLLAALCACVVAGCGLSRMVREARARARTPTPSATPTPMPEVSTPPPPTTQPTTAPIAGFSRFTGTGIELWLPESFKGGDLSEDLDLVVDGLNELGYGQAAEMIKANPDVFVLWTFDSEVGPSGFVSSATVTTQSTLSAFTIDNYVDLASKQYPAEFVVSEVEVVDQAPFEARRLIVTNDSLGTKQLQFIYMLGGEMWAVTYSTSPDEFEERLPSFELSASTFRVTD